jgi:sugar-specific transcriptional regulator TrmB
LEKFVEGLEPPVAPGNLWSIIGYKNMILKAREMILDAETSVYLSAWDREIKKLKTELKEARDRGIKILIFTFTRTHCRLPNVLSYNIPTAELEKLWKPRLMLIKDDEELLLGEANDQDKKHAAWTKNPAIISTVRDALVLDITFYSYRMGKPVERDLIENQFILDSDIEKLLTKYNPGIKTVPYTAPVPQLVEN